MGDRQVGAGSRPSVCSQQGRDDWTVLSQALGRPSLITAELVAASGASRRYARDASILDRARNAVAFALTQTITLLAPSRIVHGRRCLTDRTQANWLDPIRHLVNRDVFEPFRGQFEIVPAALGEEVVVHGALALSHAMSR